VSDLTLAIWVLEPRYRSSLPHRVEVLRCQILHHQFPSSCLFLNYPPVVQYLSLLAILVYAQICRELRVEDCLLARAREHKLGVLKGMEAGLLFSQLLVEFLVGFRDLRPLFPIRIGKHLISTCHHLILPFCGR
jgi:hypothetical protein